MSQPSLTASQDSPEQAASGVHSSSRATNRRRAVLALVSVNVLWGTSFPVMKCLNHQVDQYFGVALLESSSALRAASASWMIGLRFGIAFVLLLIVAPHTLRLIGLRQILAGAAIGGLFFTGLMLQVIGLATIDASRSGFLTSLAVVFTPIGATIAGRRLPRPTVGIGVLLALVGVAVLTQMVIVDLGNRSIRLAPDALDRWSIGDTLTTLGAVFFSSQILLVDALGKRYESAGFTPSMFAVVTVLAITSFCFWNQFAADPVAMGAWVKLTIDPSFILLILFLSVFASLVAFSWMNRYQPSVSAVQAAVIYTLEPVCASLWAMVLPGVFSYLIAIRYANETFSTSMLLGGALILAANVLALWPARRR